MGNVRDNRRKQAKRRLRKWSDWLSTQDGVTGLGIRDDHEGLPTFTVYVQPDKISNDTMVDILVKITPPLLFVKMEPVKLDAS